MSGASRWLEDISNTANPETKVMAIENRTHLFVRVIGFIYVVFNLMNAYLRSQGNY
jgi:hypothetical protein